MRLEQRIGVLGGEESQIIEFEQQSLKGLEHLEKLYKNIKENRTLKIMYEPYHAPIQERIIKSVLLKQYNNRWFLFGWESGKEKIQNLALDRIVKFSFWHEEVLPTGEFNPKNYFKDIIGVTVPDNELENVVFKVRKNRAFYIETKLIHSSQQKIAEDDSSITFSVSVKPNNEMWGKLMELSEDLEIIEPQNIKSEMKSRTKR